MSYVLDALRKADAERERGSVPTLHAQPFALATDDDPGAPWQRPALWITVGLVVALAGVSVWRMMAREAAWERQTPNPSAQATAPVVTPAPTPSVPPAPAPQSFPVDATPAPAPAAPSLFDAPAVSAPPPVVTAARPSPAPSPVPQAAPTQAPESPARPAATAPPPAAATATGDGRIYALNELPADIRRDLPALEVGGSMYSANPASRMLIVRGQTVQEGATLGPQWTLEQIGLKEAVLRYKGYRYKISY